MTTTTRVLMFAAFLGSPLPAICAAAGEPAVTVVHGQITDANGCPLPGARVLVQDGATGRTYTTASAGDGKYRLETNDTIGVDSRIRVELIGFTSADFRTYVPRGETVLDVGLQVGVERIGHNIHGRVVDGSGATISDATVVILLAFNPVPIIRVRTNDKGEFALPADSAGEYVVLATKSGYAAEAKAVHVGEMWQGAGPLEIRLEARVKKCR